MTCRNLLAHYCTIHRRIERFLIFLNAILVKCPLQICVRYNLICMSDHDRENTNNTELIKIYCTMD